MERDNLIEQAQALNAAVAVIKEYCDGRTAEAVAAAEELRDIARVLSITAGTDTNIREAMTGILSIADRLEGGKSK